MGIAFSSRRMMTDQKKNITDPEIHGVIEHMERSLRAVNDDRALLLAAGFQVYFRTDGFCGPSPLSVQVIQCIVAEPHE